jgi:F5/8 type C domain
MCAFTASAATNLALGKEAAQSSTWSEPIPHASAAVDGNRGKSDDQQQSCSRTGKGDLEPWLSVDLGQQYHVQGVVLTSRGNSSGQF